MSVRLEFPCLCWSETRISWRVPQMRWLIEFPVRSFELLRGNHLCAVRDPQFSESIVTFNNSMT